MDRRVFLAGTGAVLGNATLAHALPGPMTGSAATPPADKWEEVRRLFDIDYSFVQMAGFYLASHPRPVRDAIEQHRRALDRNPYLYVEDNITMFETQIRADAGLYLAAGPETIAVTDSTTMGLGTVYTSMNLTPNQEILTTVHDHMSTVYSLQYLVDRTGAPLKRIALYEDGAKANKQEIVSRIQAAITDRTRIIAITWVHSSTGVKLPLYEIGEMVKQHNKGRDEKDAILLCVDGVHGFGIENVTVADLNCDFFVAGCHKWLLGPRGTGLIWGSDRGWRAVRPTIFSFDLMWQPFDKMSPANWMTPGGFHTFEHRWALSEAFQLQQHIGKAAVQQRIHQLNRRCKEEMSRMPHVKLHTPMSEELSSGMICFDIDGMKQVEVVACLLEKKIIASITPYQVSYARLTPSLLNSMADVEKCLQAVRDLGPGKCTAPLKQLRAPRAGRIPLG
jgi:selenocysteine lyase/cysteine desulfurase